MNSADVLMEYVFKGLRKSIYDSEPLRLTLAHRLDLPDVDRVTVERESIDARRKPDIYYIYNLRFTVPRTGARLQQLLSEGVISPYAPKLLPDPEPRLVLPDRPIIVGFGPAGIFAGLHLARLGYRPIIFERGEPVRDRVQAVNRLWTEGVLDPESNMQFGEGGAGTFSDGKLTTGKASALDRLILETFVEAGALEVVLFQHRPHIGTDRLRQVVVNLRKQIVARGGEVHFGHKLTAVHLKDGAVEAITVSGQRIPSHCVILAIGHSARDTVSMLHAQGVALEPKSFAVGARIEHPAEFINETQYGKKGATVLPAADYKLTHRQRGAGVYSFCVCPGGQVVCAASELNGLVTNGMSRYARDDAWSNSAIVVSVDPAKLDIHSPLEAIEYQRCLERRAFEMGGGGYVAPAQRAADFLSDETSHNIGETTYRPGVVAVPLGEILPNSIVEPMKAGLRRFDRTMPGFVEKGVLIAPETRTSSPVRILRDGDCRSISTEGLYLLGEGAGYAGGIMTCARDALRFARLVRPRG
jgi:uncharacterized FAD-dependent dehydrogenase